MKIKKNQNKEEKKIKNGKNEQKSMGNEQKNILKTENYNTNILVVPLTIFDTK